MIFVCLSLWCWELDVGLFLSFLSSLTYYEMYFLACMSSIDSISLQSVPVFTGCSVVSKSQDKRHLLTYINKWLIRLRKCAVWPETLLGAHIWSYSSALDSLHVKDLKSELNANHNCNRQYFDVFFLVFFRANKTRHFMWIICLVDDSHKMPSLIFSEFVCVEVLRPSQPNGVMSSVVSLPNHTFTGQA